MAEIDAASAEAPAKPIPERTSKTSNLREEGELSSSDGDELPASSEARELPACSAAVITGAAGRTAEPTVLLPTSKSTQGIKKGKSVSTNNLTSFIGIRPRTSMQTNYSRTVDKNRVPFKSVAPGWYGPPPASDNLVISFSDDDSGSDSEKHKKENSSGTKIKSMDVDGNRRPPVPSQPKQATLRNTTRNVNKVVPKKLPSSRTSLSSTTQIHGTNPRGVLSSTERESRAKNVSIHDPILASQGRGLDQGSNLNNSELQDLRHQIAIRESALRLKSAQQNKEAVISTSRDYNPLSLDSGSTRKYRGTSGEAGQSDLEEPNKKRLKAVGPYFGQKISDGQPEIVAASPFLIPKDQGHEARHLKDKNTLDYSRDGKEISMGRIEPDIVKSQKQDNRKRPASSENVGNEPKDGADVNTSCSQSDRSPQQVDPCSMVNQHAALPDVAFSEPNNLNNAEFRCPTKVDGHHPLSTFPNRVSSGHNLMRDNDDHEVISKDKALKPTSSDVPQTSQKSTSTWNGFETVNVPRNSNMDFQSLTAMEDMLDKDLEDAQEHRRRCEIEERKALKAYRKAQRALIEANSKCNHLYRQRELCSAQFRSFIMDDSTLLWSSRPHEPVGIGLRLSDNMFENNMDQLPTPMQAEFGSFNQGGYDSIVQCTDGAHISYQRMNGLTLGSEPCSEPDASTSELLPHTGNKTANRVRSLSNDPNISADEDEETFPHDHEMDLRTGSPRKERSSVEGGEDINMTQGKHSLDNSEDTLLLEANLRSELCARFGMKKAQGGGSMFSMQPSFKQWAEHDVETERAQTNDRSLPYTEAEKTQQGDFGDKLERNIDEVLTDLQSPDYASGVSLPAFILRSAFRHMKVSFPIGFVDSCTSIQQNCLHNNNINEGIHVESDKIQSSFPISNILREARDMCGKDIGSYACDLAIDPFWPLCMYELRGKCNDDECSWQHVKDYLGKNMNNHIKSAVADSLLGSLTGRTMFSGTTKESEHPKVLAQPTYLVGLDTLATDTHTGKSIVTRESGQCWRRCFSISLAVSSWLQTELAADEPLLFGCDGRVEVNGSWSRQALYFQTKNGGVTQYKQGMTDSVQSLEIALLVLNQEVSRSEGIKKALSVLSRALESDPASVPLWIVYLMIFSSNKKSDRKDDMFSQAVKHNEGCYELWVMYINSRIHLKDRLDAYDAAISALCQWASTLGRDLLHDSTCILDLYLQMMDCLCMSGNVSKAIQRVYGLLYAKTNSDDPRPWSFSDILSCLTISDKCIFWICCVYLLTYRKLPDTILERFEVEKDLVRVEWPSVHLTDERKQQAVKLMEMAVNSIESDVSSEFLKKETALRSLHLFAVNHIRCMVAVDGLDCRNVLDKYTKLYPTCLELVFLSLWMHKNDYGESSIALFEDAIDNWPKGAPGLECLWNQYAEYALRDGRMDFAKELMDRWFNSVWKIKSTSSEIVDIRNIDGSCVLLGSNTASDMGTSCSESNQMDKMFGLLNLSLHKLFQNNHSEARLSIDDALKAAAPKSFEYCVREHATFLLTDGSELKDAPIDRILNILISYMNATRVYTISEPLSRKFLNDISKPRVKQLVGNILSPVSSNFCLINMVLEVWYGPSLLPQAKSKDLVDFVESILEISPSNYKLAISVCKHFSSSDVTSAAVMYWACLLLVRTMFQAIPIAPEYIWIEAANILVQVTGVEVISETFHKRALSVYPFSVNLWKSYRNLCRSKEDINTVVGAASEKGIELG